MTAVASHPGSRTVFDVREGELTLRGEQLLRGVELRIGNAGVTVILGPSGTGKSCLLRALAGVRSEGEPQTRGDWRRAVSSIDFLPQTRRALSAGNEVTFYSRPAEVLGGDADVVMLDEPDRQVMPEDREGLSDAIRERARRGPVILVTHDLRLAKAVADNVVFVCAGRIRHTSTAREFFHNPPSQLIGQFLRQGNCWPKPELSQLPPHFRWVVRGKLAGMGQPGLMRDVHEDLDAIVNAGVTLLVSLTEEPMPQQLVRSFGLQSRHLPIRDMHVPAIGPTARLCAYVENHIRGGGVVAMHCRAGLGRTGTVLASFLSWLGDTPTSAIERVRGVQPMAIQTRAQEQFVSRFARDTASTGRPGSEAL